MRKRLGQGIRQGALLAALLGAGLAWGQMTPQQHQQHLNEIGQYYQQNSQGKQSASQGPSAAEIRAWEEREAEIQARIARHRATPWYMGIVRDIDRKSIFWPGGYASEQRVREEAAKNCKSGNCEILAVFANSCAVLVYAHENPQSREDFFIGIDADDSVAADKALRACEAVHGDRQDRCFYSTVHTGKGVEGTAFCVGYDHSIYGQE